MPAIALMSSDPVAHRHADRAVLQHRDVDYRVAERDGVLPIRAEMREQPVNRMGLGDALDSEIAEQRRRSPTAPRARFEVGETPAGVEEVLVRAEHVADLVHVVPVQFTVEDHVGERLAHGQAIDVLLALAGGILADGVERALLEALAGEQAVVAFQIEFKAARMASRYRVRQVVVVVDQCAVHVKQDDLGHRRPPFVDGCGGHAALRAEPAAARQRIEVIVKNLALT